MRIGERLGQKSDVLQRTYQHQRRGSQPLYIQNYREAGMFESVETYARGLTIGHSRAAVE